jgi:glycosyltransferase involved in cell wall biosynthesis
MKRFKKIYALIFFTFWNIFARKRINYITDNAGWVISDIGNNLKRNIKESNLHITITAFGIRDSIIHYGSIGTFIGKNELKLPHKSNIVIVTWFHVLPNEKRFSLVIEAVKYVDIWHTSSELTKNKMISLGVPKDRIIVIPLGVDLDYFNNFDQIQSKEVLGIPKDKIVIGYFQKDGNGWKEGNSPKLIKGPDIFCAVITRLSKKYDIFILLTGPARGYVKNYLLEENIDFIHTYLDDPNKVATYYKASDLYLITSREEGGPKSILESMACGVPLVSSKVGMAEDVIIDGINGFLVDVEDIDSLYNRACILIENNDLRLKIINNGLDTVKSYSWKKISKQYFNLIYMNSKINSNRHIK